MDSVRGIYNTNQTPCHKPLYFIELYCIALHCIDGVVIATQCTAIFPDLLCSPEFRYY